ncbi:MAG: putative lipid II flippase FtsW [Clostridiales bacterium]|nr:putative lipid II flippase FtsW [Clostridiales bacterium]
MATQASTVRTRQSRTKRKRGRDLTQAEKLRRGPIDLPFLMLTMLLLVIGLIMLLSASSYAALYDSAAGYKVVDGVITYGDAMYYFKHQAIYAVIGVVAMFLVSRMDYQYLRILSVPILVVSIILLILVMTPLGVTANNAKRWLHLFLVAGPTFQPSEIAKLGVILFFSAGLSKRRPGVPTFQKRLRQPLEGLRWFFYWSDLKELIPYMAVLVVVLLLIGLQPHLSCMILVAAAAAAVLFAAGIRIGWFIAGAGGLAGVVYYVLVVVGYNGTRIKSWLDPWWDPSDKSYQVLQSIYAVASGGLTGLGFGQSRQKYLYLPEEQNDYIFAIICEELGLIGAVMIILLFALLIIRGYYLALHAKDKFGTLLIVGIITLLATQVFLNIAVVLNVIPSTGISLPFFSYGGTALAIQLAEMGIVLSVSRQIAAPPQG